MATVGIAPSRRRPRSRRWIAVLRRLLLPTEMAALLLACGWFHYMDLDPQITISVAPLPTYHLAATGRPSPNALDFCSQAAKIKDQFDPNFFDMGFNDMGFNSAAKAASAREPVIFMKGQVSLFRGDPHRLPRGARLVIERETYLIELQRNNQLLRRSARN